MDVGAWLDRLYAAMSPGGVQLEPLVDPEDRGVPPEMADGEVQPDGNVRWTMLPGTLGRDALAALEARTGSWPDALVGWLLARHHLFDQLRTSRHLVTLPSTPVHAPLRDVEENLESWAPLVEAGWLPIGDFDAGAGPLCLDLRAPTADGDAPVVWFDHEELFAIEEPWTRERVAALATTLYPSFEALLRDVAVRPPS